MNFPEDTIAAISTPSGIGGISVIRISGKDAINKADTIFHGKRPLSMVKTHTAHFGKIMFNDGTTIDEVVATVFKEPHSYTAENLVEISCHGGYYVTKMLLENILATGIRHATPGEFTKRAFLNKRIDLVQAEAVAEMINSTSTLYHRAATAQLEGKLSSEIEQIRGRLLSLSSLLEIELDFAEEGVELQNRTILKSEISTTISILEKWIDSYKIGKIYKDGIKVAIVGKPNVGKSSIFNALLCEERSIVTEMPGTTRDFIEENLAIGGILFNISDTAGVRESVDLAESRGIERTNLQIRTSDVVILVLDPTQQITEADNKIISLIMKKEENGNNKRILIFNKYDIVKPNQHMVEQVKLFSPHVINLSAKTNYGLNDLRKTMISTTLGHTSADLQHSVTIINERHKECIVKAKNNLINANNAIINSMSNEYVSFDIHSAMKELGEIIGVYSSEELLNTIFSKFCIGK